MKSVSEICPSCDADIEIEYAVYHSWKPFPCPACGVSIGLEDSYDEESNEEYIYLAVRS